MPYENKALRLGINYQLCGDWRGPGTGRLLAARVARSDVS